MVIVTIARRPPSKPPIITDGPTFAQGGPK